MNKKNSRNKHQKGANDVTSFLKTVIFLIASILIVVGVAVYLKSTNGLIKQKEEIHSEPEYTVEKVSEEPENHVENVTKEPIKKSIILSFAGDFTLGTDTKFEYNTSLPAAFIKSGKDYSYFLQNVSNVFSSDNYTLVNLETTFTDSDEKAPKDGEVFYNFKGPKEYVNILTNGSIEGVTIANNHIYDYGKKGMTDTVNALKENRIDICGEGYKILRNVQGVKIGFLGYTGWEYSRELKEKIKNDISELRKQGAQIIIPYFHWGIERSYKPYDVQENLARFSIDSGADSVIGSHPHVIQSMENYKGKLIVYSMGNFCFGGNSNPPDKRTFILQARINMENDKIKNFEYKVLPAMISSRNDKNDYIPTLAAGNSKEDILNTLNELSPTLRGKIKDEFFEME